ncbi:hypothetical protein [Kangiella shandongensis]|uniref:hypothetical protein n=1 Tax=Kangiella shandongensis TaxID=2763258 RepID=UPI001CBCF540|nr:hypothetical protein [Kangiella shandongensis]
MSEECLQQFQQSYKDIDVIVSVTGSGNEEIIITLSEIINRFNGRLQASRFNRMNNVFNGLLYISINPAYFGSFRACLDSLSSERLNFELSPAEDFDSKQQDRVRFEVELFGLKDHAVDVALLRALARNQLVIDELSRKRYMHNVGKPLYKVRLQVSTDYIIDMGEVEKELQLVAEDLAINLVLRLDEEDMQEAI